VVIGWISTDLQINLLIEIGSKFGKKDRLGKWNGEDLGGFEIRGDGAETVVCLAVGYYPPDIHSNDINMRMGVMSVVYKCK
jgi:hypothetical protein